MINKNTLLITTLLIFAISLVSLTLAEEVPHKESLMNEKFVKAMAVLGLGFAAGLGALGIGILSRSFIEGIYRNPETTNKMLIWFFVAFALIEAQVLYTLFFVFQLFFAK